MKKALSMILAALMMLTTLSCLSVVSFAAEAPAYEAEVEGNDTYTTAQEIEIEKTYVGVLSSSSDVDWYVFETTDDYFEVTLNYESELSAGNINDGWYMDVYADGDFSNYLIHQYSIKSAFVTPKLPYSGKFYVKVYKGELSTAP
ncbi:MAG: hypothetical protein IKV44_04300, partial [Clostridia bacterium]|nr:hypothetical protein [Clostridia bacterium]